MEKKCYYCGNINYGQYLFCPKCEAKEENKKATKIFVLNYLADQLIKHGAGPFIFDQSHTGNIDIEKDDVFVFYCSSSDIFESTAGPYLKNAGIKYRTVETYSQESQYLRRRMFSLCKN